MEVEIYCLIAGERGDVFSVKIDDSESVGNLKKAIKDKKPATITCHVKDLKLFLAKKDGAWLTQLKALEGVSDMSGWIPLKFPDAELSVVGLSEEKTRVRVSEQEVAVGKGTLHVLVKVPSQTFSGKRTRVVEWFADEPIGLQTKKRKVDEDEDRIVKYFTMAEFPPLVHPMQKYSTIMERDSFRVLFAGLMRTVKEHFKAKSDANLIVTGNPDTGKSRFYLYCIFQLVCRRQTEVQQLPPVELVLNCNQEFHHYQPDTKTFVAVSVMDVMSLKAQKRVLRLIDGNSSIHPGWNGVSILFASPGTPGTHDYAKVESATYIVSAWTLDELQDCNSLLNDKLKLPDDVLTSRFYKFGGIPRCIFTRVVDEQHRRLTTAIASVSVLDIISFVKKGQAVKDGVHIHLILEMVPSKSDFRTEFHLDFLSMDIAEKIVFKAGEDSLDKVSQFAIANADVDSESASAVRDKIYKMLCHKWFCLPEQQNLMLKPLNSPGIIYALVIFGNMSTERFSTLDEIKVPRHWVYYRPKSKTFDALDGFILTGKTCFAFHITLHPEPGIKSAPLNKFIRWMNGVGIDTDRLQFVFVVPSRLADSFHCQTTRTDSKWSGALADVHQFVASLDAFVETKTK